MSDRKEKSIESQLRTGERLLWSGRPAYEAGVAADGKGSPVKVIIFPAIVLASAWYVTTQLPEATLKQLTGGKLPPGALVGILGAILIMFVLPRVLKAFKFDNQSRLDRYFLSQAYAITDQRVIIMGDGSTNSYGPEDLAGMKLRERGSGHGDIHFFQLGHSGSSDSRVRDPVAAERRNVGFKRLPDAGDVHRRLEQWVADYRRAAAEASEAFNSSDPDAGNTYRNAALGLSFKAPDAWTVEVRNKKAPHGSKFMDDVDWKPYGGGDNWNTARIRGPMDCQVLLELFETEPTMTLDSMTKPLLVKMLIGKPIESDPNIKLNGMPGFTATWQKDLIRDKEQQGHAAGISAAANRSRIYGLHDGRRQLYIVCRWPGDSPELGEAVEKVVRSIECGA